MLYNDVANAKYFFLCFHSNYYANRKSNGNINIKFIDNIRKDTASLQECDLKGITRNRKKDTVSHLRGATGARK